MFVRFDGEVRDRGDYIVARSPLNPDFYWGNFLLFPEAPVAGDLARWSRRFGAEFGADHRVRHLAFGWDGDAGGDTAEFVRAGFSVEDDIVLTARALAAAPAAGPAGVTVRALRSDGDWEALAAFQATADEEMSKPAYQSFKEAQRRRYRRMADAGLGFWLGAFADDRLVAQLGLYFDGRAGRYQDVLTHPDHRRRGIATALVQAAGARALAGRADELVIVAGNADAERIYRRVGFTPAGRQHGLYRPPLV